MAASHVLDYPDLAARRYPAALNAISLESLYERYAPLIFRRCRGLLGTEEDAKDALHDVFVILHRELPSFRGDADVLTWVYRITTNHCLNRIRDRKTRARLEATLDEPRSQDPRPAIERRLLLTRVSKILSARQVQILVHRYYDDMNQTEIAELVGLSERSVRTQLDKINRKARAHIEELERLKGIDHDD